MFAKPLPSLSDANPLRPPVKYRECDKCKGDGSYVDHVYASHAWRKTPEGDNIGIARSCPKGYPTPIGELHEHGQCQQFRCIACTGYGMIQV